MCCPASQKCRRCGATKPEQEFSPGQRECKPCRAAYESVRRRLRPNTKTTYRNGYLKKTYGIGLTDEIALFEAQDGQCAICETSLTLENRHVDHCHATGRVRALLCSRCNHLIGWLETSSNILPRALEYLASHA